MNPADAKYCNECGAPLAATPCAKCGTVNDAGVTDCRTCGEPTASATDDSLFLPLPFDAASQPRPARRDPAWDAPMFRLDESKPAAPDAAAPAPAPVSPPPPGRRASPLVVIAVATVAALGAIAYVAYRPATQDPAPADTTARQPTGGAKRAAPAERPAAAVPTAPVASEKPAPPTEPAKAAAPADAAKATAPAARAASSPPPARAESAAPPVKRAVVEPVAPRPAETPNLGPCTDALAALGLCTQQAPSRKEP